MREIDCSAFLEIYKNNDFFGEVTNIGMNAEISIGQLVNEIMKIIGVNLPIESDNKRVRPEKSEVDRLVCNNIKLINYSSWEPQFNLKSGLKQTIDWFRENPQPNKVEHYYI